MSYMPCISCTSCMSCIHAYWALNAYDVHHLFHVFILYIQYTSRMSRQMSCTSHSMFQVCRGSTPKVLIMMALWPFADLSFSWHQQSNKRQSLCRIEIYLYQWAGDWIEKKPAGHNLQEWSSIKMLEFSYRVISDSYKMMEAIYKMIDRLFPKKGYL